MQTRAKIDRSLTITSKPLKSAQARLPGGLIVPAHKHLWYYILRWGDGSIAATMHIGEGIVFPGQDELWRVVRHDGIRTLMMPSPGGGTPAANLFMASTGIFGKTCRVTLGDERLGGYELEGQGWRGARLRNASDGRRLIDLRSEGDPPTVYHVNPVAREADVPLSALLLVSYYLTEKELREGCWVPRPTQSRQPSPAPAWAHQPLGSPAIVAAAK